jgi:outer membrane PBP1 activator LpoA protein
VSVYCGQRRRKRTNTPPYFTYYTSGKQMKISLVTAAVAALLLSACGKEAPKPAPQAVPEAPKAEAPAAPAAAAPAAVSDEDKAKAMEAAKAAAKSAGGKSE